MATTQHNVIVWKQINHKGNSGYGGSSVLITGRQYEANE